MQNKIKLTLIIFASLILATGLFWYFTDVKVQESNQEEALVQIFGIEEVWYQIFEENQSEQLVYERDIIDLPAARFRDSFIYKGGAMCEVLVLDPTDAHYYKAVHCELYQNGETIIFELDGKEYEIISQTENEVILSEINSELIEYRSEELGISFQYPKSFGPVNISLDSPDGIGHVVSGNIGQIDKFPRPFSFYTATVDFIAGDSEIPAGLVKPDPCGQYQTSCEEVKLKNGAVVFLTTRLDNPELNFNRYMLHIPLQGSDYTHLRISSANQTILTSLAPTIEVFIPTKASYEVTSAGTGWPEGWISWPEVLEGVTVTKISEYFGMPSYVIILPTAFRELLPDSNVQCVGDSEISTCVVGINEEVISAFNTWADFY